MWHGQDLHSLKIAEQMAGAGGRVLFLVPSLSLLSQTLTDWSQESHVPLHSFAICSDSDVGKKASSDDEIKVKIHEPRYRRNVIERMFCRMKDWRRIATRYDRLARNFLSAVALVATACFWLP
jgi:predicted helicase